jgi:hypothetical protein
VAAEGLTAVAIVALWVASFTLTLSTGIDGMDTLTTLIIVTINTAMASIGWALVLVLADVLRRLVRRRMVAPAVPA